MREDECLRNVSELYKRLFMIRMFKTILIISFFSMISFRMAVASPRALECRELGSAGEVLSQFTLQDGTHRLLTNGGQASLSLDRDHAVLSVQMASGSIFSVSRPGRFRRSSFLQVQLTDSSFVRCEKAF